MRMVLNKFTSHIYRQTLNFVLISISPRMWNKLTTSDRGQKKYKMKT